MVDLDDVKTEARRDSSEVHKAAGYGAGVQYWDERHTEDAQDGRTFDWLFEYAHLRSLLGRHIAKDASVLQLGCGNSRLALEWCLDGHRGPLRNVDFAPGLVEQMRAELRNYKQGEEAKYANVSYDVADVRSLSEDEYPSGSFDAVLDKATFDCIACNGQADLESMLLSAYRVLKPGGTYLLISFGNPESRLAWLDEEPGLNWKVSVSYMTMRSQRDTDRNFRGDGEDKAADGNDGDPSGERTPFGDHEQLHATKKVFLSGEVMVTDNDSWEEELHGVGEDDYTFVYICRKSTI